MSAADPGSSAEPTRHDQHGHGPEQRVEPDRRDQDPPVRGLRRTMVGLALAVTVLALLGVAVLAGRWTAPAVRPPSNPVDIGFSQDMQVHHAQGVRMALTEYQRTRDGSLRYLAFDIATSQQAQLGVMTGWLQLWGANQSSTGPKMAWMGQPHTGPMPGMATAPQVASLRTLPVPSADEQFLRLMIRHHQGALPMAAHARDNASTPQLREFAGTMHDVQLAEITQMQQKLQDRGLAREPDTLPGAHAAPPTGAGHGEHVPPAPTDPVTPAAPGPAAPAGSGSTGPTDHPAGHATPGGAAAVAR